MEIEFLWYAEPSLAEQFSFTAPMDPVLTSRKEEFDASFLRLVRQGDAEAFAKLVRVFGPRIRRIAMQYFRKSPFDQEEAVQEVFLLLHRQREAIDPLRSAELPGFVLTLARRRMVDLLRARRIEPPAVELQDDAWADETEAPLQQAADAELLVLMRRFEEKLKPAYRAYFRAVFIEGKEFDEARDVLGLARLRARYLKLMVLRALRRHPPLLQYLGKRGAP